MPEGFDDIPGWSWWEDAGAGVAVADLDGSGVPDLVVLTVDAPAGVNAGFYRVGRGAARQRVQHLLLELPHQEQIRPDGGEVAFETAWEIRASALAQARVLDPAELDERTRAVLTTPRNAHH